MSNLQEGATLAAFHADSSCQFYSALRKFVFSEHNPFEIRLTLAIPLGLARHAGLVASLCSGVQPCLGWDTSNHGTPSLDVAQSLVRWKQGSSLAVFTSSRRGMFVASSKPDLLSSTCCESDRPWRLPNRLFGAAPINLIRSFPFPSVSSTLVGGKQRPPLVRHADVDNPVQACLPSLLMV